MPYVVLWGPVALHMAAIFMASSAVDPAPLPGRFLDKVIHLGIYAVLGALAARAFAGGLRHVTPRAAALAILFATLYGISDEWHQSFVPGRTPDALDVLADSAGAAIGALALLAMRRRPEPRTHEPMNP